MGLSKKYWVAIICKIGVVLTTLLISIFINRGLGVIAKGAYAYVINWVEVLYILFSLGIGQAYSTLKREGEDNKSTFLLLSIFQGLIVAVLGTAYIFIFNPDYGEIILVLTIIAVLKVVVSMIAVIEESIKRNLIQCGVNFLYLFSLIILYFFDLCSLYSVLLVYGINDFIRVIILIRLYHIDVIFKRVPLDYIKKVYKIGVATMIVTVLISVNYSIDTIMLKKMASLYEVGIYSVGVTFSNMFLLIPDAFKEVLFGDSTRTDFEKSVAFSSIKISVIMSGIILISFIVFGKFAINLLYGNEFIGAYEITWVLFIGSFSMIFFKILQPIYISHGKQLRAMMFLVCSVIFHIGLNCFLIPAFNGIGAAISSAISYTICGFLFIFNYIKYGIGDK